MKQSIVQINNDVYVDGKKVEGVPGSANMLNICQVNDKLYVNGYKYVNGKWRRTIGSIFYHIFG